MNCNDILNNYDLFSSSNIYDLLSIYRKRIYFRNIEIEMFYSIERNYSVVRYLNNVDLFLSSYIYDQLSVRKRERELISGI